MRIVFTLLLALIIFPFTGKTQTEEPVYNADDVAALRKIAEENPEFIYREDWLSETPEWKGVQWAGDLNDLQVTELSLGYTVLAKLDLSQFQNLLELDLSGNNLSCLDISQCLKLEVLYCFGNDITDLDISNNPNLERLNCDFNRLSFSDLYSLLSVSDLSVGIQKDVFEPIESDGVVDFSGEAVFDGQKTTFYWTLPSGQELDPEYFEELSPGKFKFHKVGQFYCKMTNNLFPDTQVKSGLVTVVSQNYNLEDMAALKLIAEENSGFSYREDWLSEQPEWKGVSWGGDVNDLHVVKLNLGETGITNLDVRSLKMLEWLGASGFGESNSLVLDISGLSNLRGLGAEWNNLEQFRFEGNISLDYLSLYSCGLKELDLTQFPKLEVLFIGVNKLTSLDISKNPELRKINFFTNRVTNLDVSNNRKLEKLNCEENRMGISTLYPLLFIKDLTIKKQYKALGDIETEKLVDYSSEANIGDHQTKFKWFHSYGKELDPNYYEELEPGVFQFAISGEFYCKMTNELLPDVVVQSGKVKVTQGDNPFALKYPWQRKRSIPTGGRTGAVGFAIEGYGFFGLGESVTLHNDFWIYSSYGDYWYQMQECPFEARKNAIGFSINGAGYVGMGKNKTGNLTDFWKYDNSKNTWHHVTEYPGNNIDLTSWVVHEGKIYFIGGVDQDQNYCKEVWCYDPGENQWSKKMDFPGEERIGAFVYSIDEKIYFGSGHRYEEGSSNQLKDLWSYDPNLDTWEEMNVELSHSLSNPCYFTSENKAYYGFSGNTADIYTMDITNGELKALTSPYVSPDRNLNEPVVFQIKNKVYLCGGYELQNSGSKSLLTDVIALETSCGFFCSVKDLKATLTEKNDVELSWNDMNKIDRVNEIYIAKGNEPLSYLTSVSYYDNSFLVENLEPYTKYRFMVKSKVAGFDPEVSEVSEVVEVTTGLYTGVAKVSEYRLNVYPNPATDYVLLEIPGKGLKKVCLVDGTGSVIRTKEVENQWKIDVNGLPSGTYFLQIVDGEVCVTKRIVIVNR